MATVEILLPTYNRLPSLLMTLSGIATQTFAHLRLIVADQSQEPVRDHPVLRSLRGVIEARGGEVIWYTRPPVHGIAEQRQFLLSRASANYVLYLDDDVLMESQVVERMMGTLYRERCGFVGAFPTDLTYLSDVRPEQQKIEYWAGPVQPEVIEPGSPQWERYHIHRAANLYHVSQFYPRHVPPRPYKVAWVGACVMYDRAKLLAVGGFSFWPRLPRYHSGEEVLVQNLLMRRWGGCALMPSGTYFAQVPSTTLNDAGTVDGHALDLLTEMVR